jgi:SAM-dependent methyltransferase
MHLTALINGKGFFDTYLPGLESPRILDIGAMDVNGSLRSVCPPGVDYVGVDMAAGKGVDVVLADPYVLPFDDASADVVVSSSCLEHCEMFWLLFLEMLRVLRPHGLVYINAPSNGPFHRYPVDCWRFYPDCGRALVAWARRSAMSPALLESYTCAQSPHDPWGWNDFVAVFLKDESAVARHPHRILHRHRDARNGVLHGHECIAHYSRLTEDAIKLREAGVPPQSRLPRD